MGGFAKKRANEERERSQRIGYSNAASSSGGYSSAGKATHSAPPSASLSANRSRSSGVGGGDAQNDPSAPAIPAASQALTHPKNVDLGASSWNIVRGMSSNLPPRQPPSGLGVPTLVSLNTHKVTAYRSKSVHQYDVFIGSGAEKRGLIQKVWQSSAVRKTLGQGWLFDGNCLAWSSTKIDREARLIVDLDKEQNRTPRPGRETANQHRILIRHTKELSFTVLNEYLQGNASFGKEVLETINFLDHVLRETPSRFLTSIKRNFYGDKTEKIPLGGAIQHLKGVYQSMRLGYGGPKAGARLTVNVDVANGTFWVPVKLEQVAKELLNRKDLADLSSCFRGGETGWAGQALKKLRKLHVVAKHRGSNSDDYVIERFVYQSAREYKFDKDGTRVSIYDYFAKAYNIRIQYPDLPLVKMTKGKNTVLPMEVLTVKPMQKYNYKLDERQTSTMIKHCATPPQDRMNSIRAGLAMLDWPSDPVHAHFGLEIDRNQTKVDARVLAAPTVTFDKGDEKPGTRGRWDLRGKRFFKPNTEPLKAWAVCVVSGSRGGKPDRTTVQNFLKQFVIIYKGHGGRVENTQPAMYLAEGDDVGSWVTNTWNAAGNQANKMPQILVFILPDKNSTIYGRIKRSADCRYGVVSQCMQYGHVQKCQAQYISNVCMKFNAKLGGVTAVAVGPTSKGESGIFKVPTVIVGADVSHCAPGAQIASTAALTMSMDKLATRYAAACDTNGFRVEMITTENINSMFRPLLEVWAQNLNSGQLPKRIYYFRDGVSEGQYQHVLDQEVKDMKKVVEKIHPAANVQFVVLVGGKRHHVRFFPDKGDKNGNPLPGTLVETGVTHPFENDFYLCSHAAIKGTARPMHYHVLLNEAKVSNDELFTLIYEHCYQYIRATTPVSQHPAIYYAHLASNRAVPHDPKWGDSTDGAPPPKKDGSKSGDKKSGSGSGSKSKRQGDETDPDPSQIDKLMPMPNDGKIRTSMWYI